MVNSVGKKPESKKQKKKPAGKVMNKQNVASSIKKDKTEMSSIALLSPKSLSKY